MKIKVTLDNGAILKFYDFEDINLNKSDVKELSIRYLRFEELPIGILEMTNLKVLDLTAARINRVPNWIGKIVSLERLILVGNGIRELPESIGELCNLKELNLKHCSCLKTLPDSIGDLSNLETLDLFKTNYLKTLPESIVRCRKLKYYRLDDDLIDNLSVNVLEFLKSRYSCCRYFLLKIIRILF